MRPGRQGWANCSCTLTFSTPRSPLTINPKVIPTPQWTTDLNPWPILPTLPRHHVAVFTEHPLYRSPSMSQIPSVIKPPEHLNGERWDSSIVIQKQPHRLNPAQLFSPFANYQLNSKSKLYVTALVPFLSCIFLREGGVRGVLLLSPSPFFVQQENNILISWCSGVIVLNPE